MLLSDKIAQKISSELNLDQDKSEIISYGAFAFIQIVLSLALVAFFGLIFGVLFEALTFSFVASILRKYSGGVHASSPNICLIIGTVVTIGTTTLMCYISSRLRVNGIWVIILGLISFAWSYYIIFKYAPVDSKAKPINTQAKRERLKKQSIIVLTIYLFISFVLIGAFYITKNNAYLTYSVCIYAAFVWQVFNLTIIGHKIMNKIDSFLSIVLFEKRGGI